MSLDRNRLVKPAQKLLKLVKKIDRNPAPEAVHDLRTSARQFETIFQVLSLKKQGVHNSAVKDLIRCRKRAGKVRDMDVLTSKAASVHVKGEEECSKRLLEYLAVRRKKQAKKLFAEVRKARAGARKDLRRTPAVVQKFLDGGANGSRDRTGPTSAAVNLVMTLADPQHFTRGNLHPYRLKVKKLRDVLRMAETSLHPRFVEDLTAVKDAIGEWHDWEELISIAPKALDHGSRCALVAELKRRANASYKHAMKLADGLRGKYLKKGAEQAGWLPEPPVWETIALLA